MVNLFFLKYDDMNKSLIIFITFVFLVSCSSPKIIVEKVSELQEINQGDSVWIYWKFLNASSVKVPILDKEFNPIDSFLFKPLNSTRIDIIAHNQKGESLVQSVYILVRPPDSKDEQKTPIQRGPLGAIDLKSIINTERTSYLSGFVSNSIENAERLKIFRISFSKNLDSCQINFGLLDSSGNMLYDLYNYSSDSKLEVINECPKSILKSNIFSFPKSLTYGHNLSLFVLIDYSVLHLAQNLKDQLIEGLKYLESTDKLSLSFFGVNLTTLFPLQRYDFAYWELKNQVFSPRTELSSIYRSLYNLIDEVVQGENSVIILITNRMDNSSINVLPDDVVSKATERNVEINIIGLGNEISLNVYRYLSYKTGGSFYHLPWDFSNIKDVLREISLSKKYYYSLTIPFQLNPHSCNDVVFKMIARTKYFEVYDALTFPFKEREFYQNYQAVALFEKCDTTISNSFFPVLNSLAALLKSNKDFVIELTGNAGLSEISCDAKSLSLSRANSVKKILVENGVNPSQIKVCGAGVSNPLYMDEDDEITAMLNRRVQIRWLLPSVLPYTIVVDTVVSEEIAEKEIDYWEKKGFKAYYSRVFDNGVFKYKIVLWGYPDIRKAENDAKIISRKYKKSYVIE